MFPCTYIQSKSQVQPHISKNTAKSSVVLHFFVRYHYHAHILNYHCEKYY